MINILPIPPAPESDIITWAEQNVKVDGHSFDSKRTPQILEPIRAMTDIRVRTGTFLKPVQSGGSTAGEILLARWCKYGIGKIQFNWQDDQKAEERFKDRILPLLKKLNGLRWAGGNDSNICEARFTNTTLIVQGVIAKGALDSETIPLQLNEEVHLWAPGTLMKARRRQTLVWNSKAFDISNAGVVGDQLEAAWEEGTMERWGTYCPNCKEFHQMHFRYDPNQPQLGGLRFDTSAGRMDNGKYNLNRVIPTIRYQMPCGFIIRDIPAERKLPGKYIKTNDGAPDYKRSWNFEAVSVPEIKWPDLVGEWLTSCKAMKGGDIKPMEKFVQERECRFWSTELIPFSGEIVVSPGVQKKRDGMKDRVARLWKADWQQGIKQRGELEHFWLVIKDIDAECNDLIVFEGKVNSETELLAILGEHDAIENGAGLVDCSFNTKHLLQFCYENHFNAIMSNKSFTGTFLHKKDGVRRFYDEGKAICGQLNVPPIYEPVQTDQGLAPNDREPLIISINKGGMIANHFFIREHKQRIFDAAKKEGRTPDKSEYIECVIPEDVSEDFKQQYESWRRAGAETKKKDGDVYSGSQRFQQIRQADHMLICCAGIDMLKDWAGMLGERLTKLGTKVES